MTQVYFRIGAGLTAVSFCLSSLVLWALFLPLVDIIQSLASESKPAQVHDVPVIGHPAAAFVAIGLAVASVLMSGSGIGRDRPRRVWWILLLAVSLISLAEAMLAAVEGPRFWELWADLQ